MNHDYLNTPSAPGQSPWNKGRLIGQMKPFRQQDIWSIRADLKLKGRIRDLALFNIAIDSKLRASDVVRLLVKDIKHGSQLLTRTMIVQKKTRQPVKFEITEQTRNSLEDWIIHKNLSHNDYLFPSRIKASPHLSTRQYSRIVKKWVISIGLDPTEYATHSLRRTKATIIYKQTKNIRAVQLLLGHSKIESTIRYLGIEVDDALELSEHIEV